MPHNHKPHPNDPQCNILGKEDWLINRLEGGIRFAVRLLAVLMTFVIFWGILDVIWVLYKRMMEPPLYLLSIHDILATFSAFMAVLIAIEIFANITMYLKENVLHVRMVVATALMAAARKVIVLDMEQMSSMHIVAIGVVVVGLGITYWLLGLDWRVSEPAQAPVSASAINPVNTAENTCSEIGIENDQERA